jgi:3-oxoadipate enol-lactonase
MTRPDRLRGFRGVTVPERPSSLDDATAPREESHGAARPVVGCQGRHTWRDMARASVNGIELYYELHGTGPALLLVPGLGADTRLFGGITGPLATTYQVIMFDPRGAGRSDKPPGPYTIEEMANDAVGLLDLLGVERAVVVGYSMGGRIALSLVLDHPTRVRRLVLAATSASTPPTRVFSRRWLALEVLSRLPAPGDRQPRWAWECQRRASAAYDATARLSEIALPTLILHGQHDHMTPLARVHEMHRAIPGSTLVEVPGGHLSLLTRQRRRFVEELHAFAAE